MGALLKWGHRSFCWLLERAGLRFEPQSSCWPVLRAGQEHRIYRCLSVPTQKSQAISQWPTSTPKTHAEISFHPGVWYTAPHTEHATSQQFWDHLHRPHQLGLVPEPNPGILEWIFYGP